MKDSNLQSLSPQYFEDIYQENDDPWNFAASEYEAAKYAETIKALPQDTYKAAFEIGCSIGILTAKLAGRCQSLLACDVSETALSQARQKCRGVSNVRLKKLRIPEDFPKEQFDLIVVSEVGYYLNHNDWKKTFGQISSHLNVHGNVILIHWTHYVPDYPQTGDVVHDTFAGWSKKIFKSIKMARTPDYRLDVWEKL